MKSWRKKLLGALAAVAAALGITLTVPPTPPTPSPSAPPVESPAPSPTASPVPEPTSVPTATPLPPVPTAPPSPSVGFPVRFPLPGVELYMRNARYGNGVDSTPRIRGDRELCELLHHVPVPNGDCHFDSDVWSSKTQRGDYEGLVLAGARAGLPVPLAPLGPVWQYKAGNEKGRCHDDQSHVNTSCDHFGSAYVDGRDDPQTKGVFEGQPFWLAFQSDEYGPYAGFFMVPQTSGATFGTQVRACLPLEEGNDATCAPWIAVDWK